MTNENQAVAEQAEQPWGSAIAEIRERIDKFQRDSERVKASFDLRDEAVRLDIEYRKAAIAEFARNISPQHRRAVTAIEMMRALMESTRTQFASYDDMAFDAVNAADALLKQLEIPNA